MRSSSVENKASRYTDKSSSEAKHSNINNNKKSLHQKISDSRKATVIENNGVRDFSKISILPSGRSSPQTKLKINSPNDKYEQEADRVAEQVTKMPNQNLQRKNAKNESIDEIRRTPNLTLQRKCDKCEEEETIQTKSMGNSGGIASPGFINQINNSRGGGQSMDPTTRTFMESRIGADFGGVKIHTNAKATRMNKEINAKAFTYGQDVYFNQGTYNPSSVSGKKLLAHELTHTIQQGNSTPFGQMKSDQIQRAPEEESTDEGLEFQYCADLLVSTRSDGTETSLRCSLPPENSKIDGLSQLYVGDVFYLKTDGFESPPKKWILPKELELVQKVDEQSAMLRVVGNLLPKEENRKLKVTIETKEGVPNLDIFIDIGTLDSTVDATNPDMVENEKKRQDLKTERKEKKQSFKNEKKKLKYNFRSLDKDDRRESRKSFRQEKSNLRKERRAERKDLRMRNRELRKEKQELKSENSCSLEYQRMITSALNKAVTVTSAGLAKLQKGSTDRRVASELSSIMKWPVGSKSDPENAEIVQKITDVLNLAKNNMLLSEHSTFNCGPWDCDENTGAFVDTSGRGPRNKVMLCIKWLRKQVSFGFAGTPDEQQAFALLHEFVHLSGPSEKPELYVHKQSEWNKLTHEQALEMADAYARIAWNLGG